MNPSTAPLTSNYERGTVVWFRLSCSFQNSRITGWNIKLSFSTMPKGGLLTVFPARSPGEC